MIVKCYTEQAQGRNTCAHCWNSIFRKKNGETVLYCGYYYHIVTPEGTCNAWLGENKKKTMQK